MDGSGRVTKRNRKFLRPITSYKDVIGGLGHSETGLRLRSDRKSSAEQFNNVVCPGDATTAAEGSSDTGISARGSAAVPCDNVARTNQGGPPSDSLANQSGSPMQSLANQEPTPSISKSTEAAGPAGQRPLLQLVSEPVSK